MEAAIPADSTLSDRLGEQESRLSTFVNLAFVFAAVGAEAMLVRSAFFDWEGGLTAAGGCFLLAIASYRLALSPAAAWIRSVEATFDLHRDDLREKLKLKVADSASADRSNWERVSRGLTYGRNMDASLAVGVKTPERLSITTSPGLTASSLKTSETVLGAPTDVEAGRSWVCRYILEVGRQAGRVGVSNGHVLVVDTAIGNVFEPPLASPGTTLLAQAEVRRGSRPGEDALIWLVDGVDSSRTALLRYELPYCIVTWSANAALDVAEVPGIGRSDQHRLVLRRVEDGGPLVVHLWDARISLQFLEAICDGTEVVAVRDPSGWYAFASRDAAENLVVYVVAGTPE